MLDFIKNNWTEIAGVLALVIIIGERVAAVTANKTDDKIFSAIHSALKAIGFKFPDPK